MKNIAIAFLLLMACSSDRKDAKEIQVPDYLYKISSVEEWQQSFGQQHVELPATDHPFIHLATEEQVPRVIKKFWPQAAEVVILKLETKKLPGRLVLEKNPGGSTSYYHLYEGSIPMDAVESNERRVLK